MYVLKQRESKKFNLGKNFKGLLGEGTVEQVMNGNATKMQGEFIMLLQKQ